MGVWTGTVPTILPGDVPTGEDWDTILDILTALTSAPTAYTPTTTNLTVGSGGSTTGAYTQVGKWFFGYVYILLGTAPTVGAVTVTLPSAATDALFLYRNVRYNDTGTGVYSGVARASDASTLALQYATNTSELLANISNILPFTWAATDYMYIQFFGFVP